MRTRAFFGCRILRVKVVLPFRQKEKGANRLIDGKIPIARVLRNADDVVQARPHFITAEIPADRVFTLEKFPGKSFVDDGHVLGGLYVLLGDAAASQDRCSDYIEVASGYAIPGHKRTGT